MLLVMLPRFLTLLAQPKCQAQPAILLLEPSSLVGLIFRFLACCVPVLFHARVACLHH